MSCIDLNCDMGESFGRYSLGLDREVMPHISSANIACGFHAGDPQVMQRTVALAVQNGVSIGAHPGLPDLVGFGRRTMDCTPEEVSQDVLYQIGALQAVARAQGARVSHVKPHGALYHMVLTDPDLGRAVAAAVFAADPEIILVTLAGPKGQNMADIGREQGLRVAREAFPDRGYTAEGTLIPRNAANALVQDPEQVAARAVSMARDQKVQTEDGSAVSLQADTLCVHGDSRAAVELVQAIQESLHRNHISLRSLGHQA